MKKIKPTLAIGIISSLLLTIPEARAEQKLKCYMINPSGEYIDLSHLCDLRSRAKVNNNSPLNSQSKKAIREEVIPRYNVRTYIDEKIETDANSNVVRPDFLLNPAYGERVPEPFSNAYYNPILGNYRQRRFLKRVRRGRSVNSDLFLKTFPIVNFD